MKSIFMRVLFCKIHCPSFICFCKPSTASHLYSSSSLKLENCSQVPGPLVVNDNPLDQNHGVVEEIVEVKEKDGLEDGEKESVVESVVLRSCMKNKGDSSQRSGIDGKKVQWMDDLGKELVDVKEFESSETGDTDNDDDNNACFCTIL